MKGGVFVSEAPVRFDEGGGQGRLARADRVGEESAICVTGMRQMRLEWH